MKHSKAGLPNITLEPTAWNLGDWPAQPVSFSKKFQAIAESFTGLDRDEIDYPPGEQTKAARRIASGQAGEPIERERRDPNQPSLESRTPHHAAARHKPAGANNLIAFPGFADHLVQDAGIVMVI